MDNSVNRERNSDDSPQSLFKNGCGCGDSSVITITVTPTTGGHFSLEMARNDTIDNLKRIISTKLKVSRERICLLHRERQLKEGTLEENELADGSRLTLLPIVETGLTAQKPELSVMNALESLNEAQVNDFLSGKAPLNLTMRLGDHMMLIQLMLSTFSNQHAMARKSEETKPASADVEMKSANDVATTSTAKAAAKKSVFNYLASTNTRLEKILSGTTTESTGKPMEIDRDEEPTSRTVLADNAETPTNDVTATLSRLSESRRNECTASMSSNSCTCNSCPRIVPSTSCTLDSVALSEATRNLTQTLKKLSSEVLTSKRVAAVPQKYKSVGSGVMHYKRKPNAIIENMEHHGRGIYSGTFSGTLNPALQDRFGRPKKDVSTIIHILNDLLCAGPRPHCRKASCGCNGASTSVSSASTSTAGPTLLSFVTADKQQTNTAEVPAACSSATATLPPNEIIEALSKNNENQTTRNKMKQLKSIMEERKEKRKAKRFSPYEKQFSCLDSISSPNVDSSQPWPASSKTDAASIHPTKSNESIEPDPSPSIHSEPVIA